MELTSPRGEVSCQVTYLAGCVVAFSRCWFVAHTASLERHGRLTAG